MSSPPKVLVVRQPVPGDVVTNKVKVTFSPEAPARTVPNLKENRAYYLTFLDNPKQDTFRIYHITQAKSDGECSLVFDLGNSFVVTLKDPIFMAGRSYIYLALHLFGLQEIGSGMLINITPTLSRLTEGGV